MSRKNRQTAKNNSFSLCIRFTAHDISVIFGYARKLSLFYQGTVVVEGMSGEAFIPSAPSGATR